MIVAVSGYSASGKTTFTKQIQSALTERGISVRLAKFDRLYLSKHLTRKQQRVAQSDRNGALGLRKIEGERGNWDRPFGLKQFVDVIWAACLVYVLRLLNCRRVLLFDRYFHDRFVHFDKTGILYRLASWAVPSPGLTFVLIPETAVWEQRILERLSRRFGMSLTELSEIDRDELEGVARRYEAFVWPQADGCRIDSSQLEACDNAVEQIALTFKGGHVRRSKTVSPS